MHTFENSIAIHVWGHIYVKVINLLSNPMAIKSSVLLGNMAVLLLELSGLYRHTAGTSGSGLLSVSYIVVSESLFLPVSEF